MFDSIYFNVITAVFTVVAGICLYVSRKFGFWKDRGIPYLRPLPFFGSLKDVVLHKTGIGLFLNNVYNTYKESPYVGFFCYDQPALLVRDLEIVKNVLVKDAEVFNDRITSMDDSLDPVGSRVLFVMKGHKWKFMRTKLSPTFTTGKMKGMFSLVDNCAKELITYLNEETSKGSILTVKDVTSKFTIDSISSCIFGIDSNSLKDPNAEFTSTLKDIFTFSSFSGLLAFFAPDLLKVFRLSFFNPRVNPFIRNTVWSTVEYREKNGIVRKDFLDTIIQMRKKGIESSSNDKTSDYKLEGDDFVALAFNFLTAGFETTSATISFSLYELALHPEVQRNLRTEITEVLTKHNNELTYECMNEMKYLDMVISEILRMYPILPFLDRKCLTDYKVPSSSGKGTITIPAGTAIYIPLMAIHFDPKYFPNPEKFDPERFTEENKQKLPNYCYLPFGEGPRFCIGMRFGLMQVKAGLIRILSNFEVEPCKDTQVPLKFKPTITLDPIRGITLSFRKVSTN